MMICMVLDMRAVLELEMELSIYESNKKRYLFVFSLILHLQKERRKEVMMFGILICSVHV